jgi:threonine synthase
VSYLSHLECSECGQTYSAHELHNLCPQCNAPLWVRYDLDRARGKLDRDRFVSRPASLWRWVELLPIDDLPNGSIWAKVDALLRIDRLAAQ